MNSEKRIEKLENRVSNLEQQMFLMADIQNSTNKALKSITRTLIKLSGGE